ncbi:MAG: UvrB/UvrC motif-containing protein [Oscillospiraceae bacterium]|nr:UvrB/UvrC motif-containing protein [Candidatus Limimonas coprohippi]
MLCQNCGNAEATTHIKRIINGEAMEIHLCYNCAEHLGYANMFSGFGFNISNMLQNFFPEFTRALPSVDNSERCPTCGTSFEEVVRTGMMGCADCYSVFYEKLKPSLSRIHGRTTHVGKSGAYQISSATASPKLEDTVAGLKAELDAAVSVQNFELAAKLRDEIKVLEGGAVNG